MGKDIPLSLPEDTLRLFEQETGSLSLHLFVKRGQVLFWLLANECAAIEISRLLDTNQSALVTNLAVSLFWSFW